MHQGWQQEWRAPLRQALDRLRDAAAPFYEAEAKKLLRDPWAARDGYIRVLLDRSPESVDRFLSEQAGRILSADERRRALELLELQRHALLMYTSCGWFFDEISGLESTQVLAYAARAMQAMARAGGPDMEGPFKEVLAKAPSNIPELGNGAKVFESLVKPGSIDLLRVGAHFAIASLFEPDPEKIRVYCFRNETRSHKRSEAGNLRLSFGTTRMVSEITGEEGEFSFAALHLGGHNALCGVRRDMAKAEFDSAAAEIEAVFARADIPELVRALDRHFPGQNFTLWHLFKDEQWKVLSEILQPALGEIESYLVRMTGRNHALMAFMREIGRPMPFQLEAAARIGLDSEAKKALAEERPDPGRLESIGETARKWNIGLDARGIGLLAANCVTAYLRKAAEDCNLESLRFALELLRAMQTLPVELDLWEAQNVYYVLVVRDTAGMTLDERRCRASQDWRETISGLGEALGVRAE